MLIKASQKYTRQTPRKTRLVANAVKGLGINDAIEQLGLIERKASILILKVLRQALANAEHNFGLPVKQLKIHSILIGTGPSYKRFRAVSRGRAHTILKRTSHVTVVLESMTDKPKVIKSVIKVQPKVVKDEKNIKPLKTAKSTVKEIKEGKSIVKPRINQLKTTSTVLRNTTHK